MSIVINDSISMGRSRKFLLRLYVTYIQMAGGLIRELWWWRSGWKAAPTIETARRCHIWRHLLN
jgi:hypothetical protein